MQWLCVLYLLLLLLVATLGKPSYPLWNNTLPRQRGKERQVNSYLFPKATSGDDSVEFIRDIMEVIHAKQHPPKEECKSRRLMIVQMSSTSFEGTGSILKQAMIAMAVAMHSNRTLVWGLGLPFMFEHSKELWAGPTRKKLKIMDKDLDCATNADPTGGPYGCFFQPLSTCTVNDISPEELLAFSHNSANETARVLMAEIRKGISLYHPPFGLFDYIWANQNSSRKYPFAGKEGYLWSSAVAAYIFRLKDSLLVDFQKLGNTLFDGGNTWGLHVRHGDLKSLADVYTYKQVYDFNDYFRAAKKLTLELKVSPSQLFVSTDSTKANQVDQLFSRYLEIDAKGLDDTEDEYEEEVSFFNLEIYDFT